MELDTIDGSICDSEEMMDWDYDWEEMINWNWEEMMEEEVTGGEGEGEVLGGGMAEGILYEKVMTDEQMEVLREQISIYVTISEQLVQMYNGITTHQNSIAGLNLNLSFPNETLKGAPMTYPPLTGMIPEVYARKRWTPTNEQRDLLEKIFKEGSGIPKKESIKGLAYSLSVYSSVTELNVLNWFYNRRAKEKRNQKVARKKKVNVNVKSSQRDGSVTNPEQTS